VTALDHGAPATRHTLAGRLVCGLVLALASIGPIAPPAHGSEPPTGTSRAVGAATAAPNTSRAAGAATVAAVSATDTSRTTVTPADGDSEDPKSIEVGLFPPEVRALNIVWVPLAGYRSEDGVGFGLEVLRTFALDPTGPSRVSDVSGSVYYTFESYKQLELRARLFWGGGRHRATLRFDLDDTSERYWGIGATNPGGDGEVYRPRNMLTYGEYLRSVVGRLNLGVRAELNSWKLLSFDPGGEFAAGGVPGQETSLVAGGGVLLDWDTRDRRYQPTAGFQLQGFAMLFDEAHGADYRFNLYNLEWRGYRSLGGGHVLATQLFFYGATGEPPFWRMAELGGRHHSRGYRRGRYRDATMAAGQFEWRFPLEGALRGVAFAGIATVANRIPDLQARYFRPTFGAGLRYDVGSGVEPVPIRCDLAFGQHSFEAYLGIGDAF
jgi:hypothetical protein